MSSKCPTSIVPELLASEQRIAKIKSDIDKFEQVYNRVSNGFGSVKYLNDEYHSVIVSTRDLSSHLCILQKAVDSGAAQDSDLRARAHQLNSQAIAQLRRLQSLGMRVQQFVRNGDVPDNAQKSGKFAPPLMDFGSDGKSISYLETACHALMCCGSR
ncbi:hypothetical protein FBUS_01974 [Fasciolopsis buskii]|uniref:Uncharacterized protein n=1 Tax=Fasciolopsis buskii TaxID=27845 RepID=A0A8E0RXH2_9TREM|nr:hypothetical protein FBUS_01974 [Fasciolopsis buski]